MSSYDPRIERVIRWQRKKWSSLSDGKKKLLWSFIYSAYQLKNTLRLFSRRGKPIEQSFKYRDFKIKKAVKPRRIHEKKLDKREKHIKYRFI